MCIVQLRKSSTDSPYTTTLIEILGAAQFASGLYVADKADSILKELLQGINYICSFSELSGRIASEIFSR